VFVSAHSGFERSPTGINDSDAPLHTFSNNKRTTGPLPGVHFSR
jgi:hypothetical protein